jgi:hypothetical protein
MSGCLVSALILSAGTLPAYAYNPYDGNYGDTPCTIKARDNSGGTPYGTGFREKRNSSSAYVIGSRLITKIKVVMGLLFLSKESLYE